MHGIVHTSVELIRQHSEWSLPILFVVSFGESFVGLSLLFPGTTIMVLAGTLVRWQLNPHGALDIWPLLVGAITGAVIGDAISFWLGLRFGHLIEKHWYFVRHPDILPRGYAFFERFGVASVFIGRFFGPVRAVVPLVAGIMEMPWRQFWFANIGSALLWAPALLFFGMGLKAGFTRFAPHGWHLTATIVGVVVLMGLVWALRRYGAFDWVGRRWARLMR
jgi:membrane protein DedA with SNARE-associated domain